MNTDLLQKKWSRLRAGIRPRRIRPARDRWNMVKDKAAEWTGDLQDKSGDLVHQVKHTVNKRRARRQNPLKRMVQRNRWLLVAASLGLIMAMVVVVRSR
jgi:hypothetical protein